MSSNDKRKDHFGGSDSGYKDTEGAVKKARVATAKRPGAVAVSGPAAAATSRKFKKEKVGRETPRKSAKERKEELTAAAYRDEKPAAAASSARLDWELALSAVDRSDEERMNAARAALKQRVKDRAERRQNTGGATPSGSTNVASAASTVPGVKAMPERAGDTNGRATKLSSTNAVGHELSRLDERIDAKTRGESSAGRWTNKDFSREGATAEVASGARTAAVAEGGEGARAVDSQAVAARGMANEPDVEFGMMPPEDVLSHGTHREPTVEYGGRVMPIATAVPEDEENEIDDLNQLLWADPYDPDAKPPMVRNRKFQFYGACIICAAVAISVALVVGLTVGSDDGGIQSTVPPTPKPTPSPTTKDEQEIMKLLSEALGTDRSYLLTEKGSPQYKAKEWVVKEAHELDEKLFQNFTLASLYYSTTRDGAEWKSCGEPGENGDEDYNCECINRHNKSNTGKRWLTPLNNAAVCDWCGIYCDGNGFVGALELLSNNLAGSIPPEISILTNLNNLLLYHNSLTGTIPSTLGAMTSLKDIQLQGNSLEGEIPEEIYDAKILQALTLADNSLIGTISTSIGRLTALKGFHTSNNMMTGEIPTEIGMLKNLLYSWHSGNMYSGPLPTEFGKLSKLKELMLVGMNLNGTIPSEMGKLTDIESLYLEQNQFEGPIPDEIYNITNIRELWLHRNQLTGTISPKVSQLKKVEKLIYSQNQLTGPIPPELGQLTKLTHLWLYWNKFNTSVPDEICEAKEGRVDDDLLWNLQADCQTTEFNSTYGVCRCCTVCCDTENPDEGDCWACNGGEYCVGDS